MPACRCHETGRPETALHRAGPGLAVPAIHRLRRYALVGQQASRLIIADYPWSRSTSCLEHGRDREQETTVRDPVAASGSNEPTFVCCVLNAAVWPWRGEPGSHIDGVARSTTTRVLAELGLEPGPVAETRVADTRTRARSRDQPVPPAVRARQMEPDRPRLFSYISRNRRGKALYSHATIINLSRLDHGRARG